VPKSPRTLRLVELALLPIEVLEQGPGRVKLRGPGEHVPEPGGHPPALLVLADRGRQAIRLLYEPKGIRLSRVETKEAERRQRSYAQVVVAESVGELEGSARVPLACTQPLEGADTPPEPLVDRSLERRIRGCLAKRLSAEGDRTLEV
jgi:hypothetical protein